LIDELFEKDFVDQVLGFTDGATLDLDKLIMAGHSMGGATAIRVGEADPRVKCVLTFDPWLLGLSKEIISKKLKGLNKDQAFLLLYSDTFHTWGVTLDHRGCYEQLAAQHKASLTQFEDIILKQSQHAHH